MTPYDGITCNSRGLQVPKGHYCTREYLSEARFLGLHAQLHACLETSTTNTILEVGPGPGLLAALLRHFGRRVLTFDFAGELRPDVLGSMPFLPFGDDAFDLVCAFEVLEHMPFELLGANLREMGRVAAQKVLITVPDQSEIHAGMVGFQIMMGKRKHSSVLWKRPLGRLTNPREHDWEIGFEGISPEKVVSLACQQNLTPVANYLARPWFHVFIFDSAS